MGVTDGGGDATAVTRFAAVLEAATEDTFRESTRESERVTLRWATVIVMLADLVVNAVDVTVESYVIVGVERAVQIGSVALCLALWLLLGSGRAGSRWRAVYAATGIALCVVVALLIWVGSEMGVVGSVAVPTGAMALYFTLRGSLTIVTVTAWLYSVGTFAAWVHSSSGLGHTQIAFLAMVVLLVHAIGYVESRQVHRERRIVFLHQRALTGLATVDDLTGLPNRRTFYEECDRRLPVTAGEPGHAAMLLIDLDRFKEVNDTLGHHIGDALLVEVAARLRRALPAAAAVARLGGDEFAVLLIRSGEAAATFDSGWAVAAAGRITGEFAVPVDLDGLALPVGASIGVAVQDDAQGRADLLRHADVAMYRAKRGGGGVAGYIPQHDDVTRRDVELAAQLNSALDANNDDICLFYKPRANTLNGPVRTVVALVRWRHPAHGLLGQNLFLPIADAHGLSVKLTIRAMRAALVQAAAWRDAGRDLRISVAVPGPALRDAHFPDAAARLLDAAGADPGLLHLEVAESTVTVDAERAIPAIQALGDLGFRFVIGGYGAGPGALPALSALPVDEVEIDGSLVARLSEDPRSRGVVRSAAAMARTLGLRVVADGVADDMMWRRLAALGCEAAQGACLTEPLPAVDIESWLDSWKPPGRTGARGPASAPR